MSLSKIDGAATRRRLQEIAAEGKRAFEAHAHRAAELAARAREAFERQEATLKEAQQRSAAAEEAAKPVEEPEPKRPKPSTLSLGGDEFRETKQAAVPQPAPEPEPRPSRPVLKLGAPEDRHDAPPPEPAAAPPAKPKPKPKPKRSPRAEGDDDLSGRTWLR